MFAQILSIIAQIPALVGVVEKLIPGRRKGSFKKSAVTGMVRIAVEAVEGISGKDLVDNEAFIAGIDKTIEGAVQAMSAVNALQAGDGHFLGGAG